MSGTRNGGLKAAATNKSRHGAEYYAKIGAMGGKAGTTGGFASDLVGKDGLTGRERAKKVGAIGGKKSRRGPNKYPHLDEEDEKGGWKWVFSRKRD